MNEESAKERLMSVLFPEDGLKLLDLKFCRGRADVISEEEFAAEVLAAMTQCQLGLTTASESFPETLHKVDVRKVVLA
jgi:hypothetical protein